ncbi:MAG: hypothetical protein ACLUMK_09705 [Christensenellales bacterium]
MDIRSDSGMYKDWCSSIGSALFEPVTMRDNGIELRHLRVITGEHIGLVPDQALYEHLRAAHPCDAVVVNTGSEEAVYTIQRYPMTMVSTDTGSYAPGEGHPQIAGSFPRYLRKNGDRARRAELGAGDCAYDALPRRRWGSGARAHPRGHGRGFTRLRSRNDLRPRGFPGLGRPTPRRRAFVLSSYPAKSPPKTAAQPA